MTAPSVDAAPTARRGTRPPPPQINRVGVNDLIDILALGLRDFRAAPTYDLFFAGIYAVGGWVLVLMLFAFDLPYLVYPLAAGFALIAPGGPRPGRRRRAQLEHRAGNRQIHV